MDEENNPLNEIKPCIVRLSAALKEYTEKEILRQKNQRAHRNEPRIAVDFKSTTNSKELVVEDEYYEDFYETQHYTLICRVSEKFYESVKTIMEYRTVGVAFEGQRLGRDGTLSLVQIATNSELFIFDMIRLGNQAFTAGLQKILESVDVMKVIHDCRWIADLLQCQHNITMANIFDTQVATAFVQCRWNEGKWPTVMENLSDCLKRHLNFSPQDENLSNSDEDQTIVWLVRPLPSELLEAAAKNVLHLLRLFHVLMAEMLVEFKAAVDIYLNYCSATSGDIEKCRATKHLLPIAFKCIHTYIKNKSDSCNMMNQQGLSIRSAEPILHEEPNLDLEIDVSTAKPNKSRKRKKQTKRNKKPRLKKSEAVAESSQKVHDFEEISRDSLSYKGSLPLSPQRENLSTDKVKHCSANNFTIDTATEAECNGTTAASLRGDSDDANSFTEENIGSDIDDLDDDTQPSTSSIATVTSAPPVASFPPVVLQESDQTHLVPAANIDKGMTSLPSRSLAATDTNKKLLVILPNAQGAGQASKKTAVLLTLNHTGQEKTQLKASSVSWPKYTPEQAAQLVEKFDKHRNKTSQLQANKEAPRLKTPSLNIDPGDGDITCESSSVSEGLQETQTNMAAEKVSSDVSNKAIPGDRLSVLEKLFQEPLGRVKGINKTTEVHAAKGASLSGLFTEPKQQHVKPQSQVTSLNLKAFDKKNHSIDQNISKERKPYKCEMCNKRFRSWVALNSHLKAHVDPYMCGVCGKAYTYRADMIVHERGHKSELPHKCGVCGKTFLKTCHLRTHELIHSGAKPYKCSFCDETFRLVDKRKAHERLHTAKKLYRCNLCEKVFFTSSDLEKHNKNPCWNYEKYKSYLHVDVPNANFAEDIKKRYSTSAKYQPKVYPYKCELCPESFDKESYLNRHRQETHVCNICGKTFDTPESIKEHMVEHYCKKPYMCDKCGTCYALKSSLIHHQTLCGQTPPAHVCELCKKTFKSIAGLRGHFSFVHKGERPFTCEVCGKAFGRKGEYRDHLLIHAGSKPFKCDLCDKTFRRRYKVTIHHYRCHTGLRPHQCDQCGKTYVCRYELNNHKKIHLKQSSGEPHQFKKPQTCELCGKIFKDIKALTTHLTGEHLIEKPFKCDVCGRAFAIMRNCQDHRLIHSGTRPFKCDLCDKTFRRRYYLTVHYKRYHERIRPHQCDQCDKTYVCRYELIAHKKKHLEDSSRNSDNLTI